MEIEFYLRNPWNPNNSLNSRCLLAPYFERPFGVFDSMWDPFNTTQVALFDILINLLSLTVPLYNYSLGWSHASHSVNLFLSILYIYTYIYISLLLCISLPLSLFLSISASVSCSRSITPSIRLSLPLSLLSLCWSLSLLFLPFARLPIVHQCDYIYIWYNQMNFSNKNYTAFTANIIIIIIIISYGTFSQHRSTL